MVPGKVYLVGAGPGDPSLITVRGKELLEKAEVVLHDSLSHPALLDFCSPSAELRNVGKRGGQKNPSQAWITAQLVELARAGRRVVRLKGGDPLLFARGAEEAEDLAAAGVSFEIVPGIPSPVAAAAYAGISLTHRELSSSATFITGSDREGVDWTPDAWHHLATATDTICVLMGMRRLEEITAAIVHGGRPPTTPAAIVQWAARPSQRVLVATLGDIAARARAEGFTNPALIFVGEVVTLRDNLRWYDRKPLFGKRLLVPRPLHQARETASRIRERSAEPVVFPVIDIVDPPDPAPLERALVELPSYDWVLFTSSNGVDRFFAALAKAGRDARAFGRALVGVIGPGTGAALARYGVRADVVAREFVGEGLAREIAGARRVLIARALVARDALPDALRSAGAHVDVVPVYRTVPAAPDKGAELRHLLENDALDVALFTSSSTVENVADLLGPDAPALLARTTVASIGPVTSTTLTARQIRIDVTATTYTVDGLLDALEAHFTPSK
ncbi:MAG TPA: uroporphyrinogen-III C-methyltransferase [Polyangiaceae bacterium]|jgi:uroporphyrinogen III methyltransferase/synthase|nr:uroporphyrinogen-III C-methyltransferase [Polyangiaceae bacterium]